ncbi:MAG: class I SAM-dependent methyltransferase [Betaproteobacteria bacterium]
MLGLFRRQSTVVLEPRDAYALWAERYPARPHNPLMRVEQDAVASLIGNVSPARALDVGTGTGRNLPLLAAAGARLVVGADLSMAMLNRHGRGAKVVCADAYRLPFPSGAFDLITASLMVGDIDDLPVWTSEMARLLAPGGRLVYSDFHPLWSAEGWRRTFDAADGRRFEVSYHPHEIDDHLQALDARGFDVLTFREPRLSRPGRRRPSVPVLVVFGAVRRADSRADGARGFSRATS